MQDKTFKYSMDEFINEPLPTQAREKPKGQFKYSMDEFINEPSQPNAQLNGQGFTQQAPQTQIPQANVTPVSEQSPLERVTGVTPTQAIDKAQEVGGTVFEGVGNFFTDAKNMITGADRQTPETRDLPELGNISQSEWGNVGSTIMSTLLASSDKDRINILKNNIPGIDFREDAKGNTVVKLPFDEKLGYRREAILNQPGFSNADIKNALGNIIAYIPAARAVGLAKTIGGKIGIGFGANAATDLALQGAGQAAGRDREIDLVQTGIAGVLGGALAPVGTGGRIAREQAEALGANQQSIKDATKIVKDATGEEVPIFKAQQSLLGSDEAVQRMLPQLSGSSKFAADRLKGQNDSVYTASMKMLDAITSGNVNGFTKIRGAAEDALKTAKQERRAASKPLYDEAFAEPSAQQINVTPLTSQIDSLLASNDISPASAAAKSLGEFKKLITGKDGAAPSLKLLQTAKIDINKRMKMLADKDSSIGNNTAATLRPFVGKLKELISNSSQKFKDAEVAFAQNSAQVKVIDDSLLPTIMKVPDRQIDNVSNTIFGSGASLQAVKDAKQLLTATPDGQVAWDGMVQSYLMKRIRNVPEENATPSTISKAIFGNESHKKMLLDSMEPQVAKNFQALYTVLERVKVGQNQGSTTAGNLQGIEQIQGGLWRDIRGMLASPGAAVGRIVRGKANNERAQLKYAKLFLDPTYKDVATLLTNGLPASGNAANKWQLSSKVANSVAQALNQIDLDLDKQGFLQDETD